MTQHTKGPWRINRHASLSVESESGRGVCSTGGYQDNFSDGAYVIENEANARLIAAAPELLEALEGIIDIIPEGLILDDEKPVFSKARAAIAKARGEK